MTRMENPKLTKLYAESERLRKESKKIAIKITLLTKTRNRDKTTFAQSLLSKAISKQGKISTDLKKVTEELNKWMEDM